MLALQGRVSSFLKWDERRDVSRGEAGRVAGWCPHPLGSVICRGMSGTLPLLRAHSLFLLALSKGSWAFCGVFVSFVQNWTNCKYTQLFLVPYNFFVFCRWWRDSSRCNHCSIAAKVSDLCLSHLHWDLASMERERLPFLFLLCPQ